MTPSNATYEYSIASRSLLELAVLLQAVFPRTNGGEGGRPAFETQTARRRLYHNAVQCGDSLPPVALAQGEKASNAIHVALFTRADLATHETFHLIAASPGLAGLRIFEYFQVASSTGLAREG
jgi:hypothetical protein